VIDRNRLESLRVSPDAGVAPAAAAATTARLWISWRRVILPRSKSSSSLANHVSIFVLHKSGDARRPPHPKVAQALLPVRLVFFPSVTRKPAPARCCATRRYRTIQLRIQQSQSPPHSRNKPVAFSPQPALKCNQRLRNDERSIEIEKRYLEAAGAGFARLACAYGFTASSASGSP